MRRNDYQCNRITDWVELHNIYFLVQLLFNKSYKRFVRETLKPWKVDVCEPCVNNDPCVHGKCKLTHMNTSYECICYFPYNGKTCNTMILFWSGCVLWLFFVFSSLTILQVRSFIYYGLVFHKTWNNSAVRLIQRFIW